MTVEPGNNGKELSMRSQTLRLVAGLLFTLLVISAYAAFTLRSVRQMRETQTGIVERNRLASLQLIRIQNDLNSVALSMRDILDNPDRYPVSAWRAPLARARQNLEDAIAREAALSQVRRTAQQQTFLQSSFAEFWRTSDEMFAFASAGDEPKARAMVRNTLQARQEGLTALTARLLIENSEQESRAGAQVIEIFAQIERNAYIFLGLSIALVGLTSASLIQSNRKVFAQVSALAEQRRELAQQLISTQESTFRAISRDLHDEFGQVLTALGAMLRRADRFAPENAFRVQVQEATEIVQHTLEKIRSLSQSLQPVILEEQGLLAAVEWHLSVFERHTGITVHYAPPDTVAAIPSHLAIHVFRILQEALSNVARHAQVEEVKVILTLAGEELNLTVEDQGRGVPDPPRLGVGLSAMRERAELIGGALTIGKAGANGGTAVRLRMPLVKETAAHV
jgi:signal transduction histidine kinase